MDNDKSLIKVDNDTQKLVDKIISEDDVDELKKFTQLFNLNQAKKNALRIIKFNGLLDSISDQMMERFAKRAGEFSNKDLLDYMTVIQNAIDRANKSLNLIDETPAININNNVNINVEDTFDRESRAKITEAVQAILSRIEQNNVNINDVDFEEVNDEET